MARAQSGQGSAKVKHEKKPRACDFCRRRKSKCERDVDAPAPYADTNCKNCIAAKLECTYEDNSKRKTYSLPHARYLEDRIQRVGKVLSTILPSLDQEQEFGPLAEPFEDAPVSNQRSSEKRRGPPLALAPPTASGSKVSAANNNAPAKFDLWREPPSLAYDDDSIPSSDDEYCNTRPPQLGTYDEDLCVAIPRYHGRSSCFSLVGQTRRITRQHKVDMEAEDDEITQMTKRMEHVLKLEAKLGHKSKLEPPTTYLNSSPLVFPPPDLLAKLVDLYFYHTNSIRPLLHRPLFQLDIDKERHKIDPSFGCVVLAVCALASRYCNDPRVLLKVLKREHQRQPSSPTSSSPSEPWVDDLEETLQCYDVYEDAPWSSAGWKYYDRVDMYMSSDAYRATILEAIKLPQVQTTYLLWQFLQGSPDPAQGWVMVGVALRRAQDVGAHLKKRYSYVERSIEAELWKRAVGCLMLADRDAGLCGRLGFAYTEYFDMMLPLEVDDKYWEMRQNGPVFLEQPAGKPAVISAFIAQLKLSVICEAATSRLHLAAESRVHRGFQPFDVIASLESAMTKWTNSLPSHLKDGAERTDPLWNVQSTILQIRYHLLRMHIYKRFLPVPSSGVSSPSTFSDISRTSVTPPHRMCTKVPTHSDAWSICALSSRVIASLLLVVTAEGPSAVPICDAPAFIAGAYFAGKFLGGIRGVKRRSKKTLETRSTTSSTSDTTLADMIKDDGVAFNACVDTLDTLRDRWESAEGHIRKLRPRRNQKQGAGSTRTPSEPDSFGSLPSSPLDTSPKQTVVPTYTEHYVASQMRFGPEVFQPIPVPDYDREQFWTSQDSFHLTYAPETTSHALPVPQPMPGTVDHLHQPTAHPPPFESQPDFKGYGFNQPPFNQSTRPYFEGPLHSQLPPDPLGEQLPYPTPEWTALRMPPYQIPAFHTSTQPVAVAPAHAQQYYGTRQHPPQEAPQVPPLRLKPYNDHVSGYSSLAPPTEHNRAEHRQPPPQHREGLPYAHKYQHGNRYSQ